MMKKIGTVKKLWLAALLVLVLGAMLCVVAGAETYSGTCGADGDNLTWALDTETGELTISGTGAMADITPWDSYSDSITEVTIESGVTSIGAYAFSHCTSLTSVTIPDGVTSIGDDAFNSCTSLTSVTIPASVTSIGDDAFYYCSSLASISVDSNNSVYYSRGYCIIERESQTLILGCKNSIIPEGVTSIGDHAFTGCSNLARVTIPASVTSIGNSAFSACVSLKSVTIPEGVTSIGDSAFHYCPSLTSVTIPASVTSIGPGVFGYCTYLTSISVDKNNSVYYSDGDCVIEKESKTLISGCKNSVIPEDVTRIGDRAFYCHTSLTSVTIPDGVTSIGDSAFSSCSNLARVTIPASVTSIGNSAFSGCSDLTSVTIPDGVTSIGDYAFAWCDNLENVTIPDGVTSIGKGAFTDCLYLSYNVYGDAIYLGNEENPYLYLMNAIDTSIISCEIHNKTKIIGSSAFSGCSNLTSVTIPDGVTSIGWGAFSGCSNLTSVTIPDGVTSIGDQAFYGCSSLTSVTIPDGVTSIGSFAFSGCSNLTSVTIPDSVTGIGAHAFSVCTSLTSVTIPNSVTSIGSSAFRGCSNLTSVTIPDGVTSIGWGAFSDCSNLTSVTIPNSVTSIDAWAFGNCTSLTSVTIPGSVTSIGDGAFYNCSSLTSVTVLSKTATIYDSKNTISDTATIYGYAGSTAEAYAEKYGRTFVDISALLAYGDCGEALTWILTKDGELIISGSGAMADYSIALSTPAPWYSYRSSIKTITIGDDVTSIGKYAFYGCSEITDITIPKGIASIGTEALSRCEKLEAITVAEDNVVYHSAGNCLIETEAGLLVAGCNTSVIPTDGSVTAIGGWAFFGCVGLDQIIIPDSVTSIGIAAFQTCTALKSIRIPEGVTLISQEAFNSCSALSEFVILSKTVEIVDDEDNFFTIPKNATIYGYEGSTAEVYAADYGRRFVTLGETEDLSMISYQVTKGEGGEFSLRLISGLNSLNYSYFGYEVTVTTKDAEGHDVVKTVSGKSNKVYTSVYGGSTAYAIKEHFGYEYAALATVTGLAVDSEYVKLDIRTYVYLDGARLYGGGAVLTYTGTADGNGYPALAFEAK